MGFFVNVTFESPIINLENLLLGRGRRAALAPGRLAATNLTHQHQLSAASFGLKQSASVQRGDQMGPGSRRASGIDESDGTNAATSCDVSERLHSSPEQERKLVDSAAKPEGSVGERQQQQVGTRRLRSMRQTSGDLEQKQQQQQQEERSLARDEGDIYNIEAEYSHYAPGSYQQWRLANRLASGRSRQSTANQRPRQYATLARTDRLSADLGGPAAFGELDYALAAGATAAASTLGRPARGSSRPAARNQQASVRLARRLEANQWEQMMLAEELMNQQQLQQQQQQLLQSQRRRRQEFVMASRRSMAASRHQGRYNTLTGADSPRAWRTQSHPQHLFESDLLVRIPEAEAAAAVGAAEHEEGAPMVGALDEPRRAMYKANWQEKAFESGEQMLHDSLGVSLDQQSGSMLSSPSLFAASWLASKPPASVLIPRVDSTTLRRNSNSRRAESMLVSAEAPETTTTAARESMAEEPGKGESSAL